MADQNIPGIYVWNCKLLPFIGALLGELHATIPKLISIQNFLGTIISLEHRGEERIWEDYLKNSESATIKDSFKQN
jgi:hypothetical protein